jgi:EmrB/QacA subfamily drug resistance transporter
VTPDDSRGRWVALIVCCSAMFMTLLDVSVTNVALPSISDSTGAGPSELQWIVSGYTLAFGLVPVLGGKLGDDHGRRVMFQVGVAGFAVTSLMSGLAPTAQVLIAARVAQGLFGGLINPQVSGLVQQMFRGSERGRAFGVLGTTVGLGTAIGPVVGGLLIALGGPDLGWRLVFFINIPIGVVVMLLARRLLPAPTEPVRHRLDIAGAALLGGATFCVLFACVEYDALRDTRLAWLGVPALVLALLFYRRERVMTAESREPLVDFRLFRRPSYVAGITLALTFFPAMAGLPLVLAVYYQRGLGYTALQSALGVTAFAVGSAVSAPLAGRVVTRVGRPLVVGGAVTFGVGRRCAGPRRAPRPGRARGPRPGPAPVRHGVRARGPDHAQPDARPDGRGPADGQRGRRRASDRSADRSRDRPGRDRRGLLQLSGRHRPGRLRHRPRPCRDRGDLLRRPRDRDRGPRPGAREPTPRLPRLSA